MKHSYIIPPPPPQLLKIYGASTASHRQNYTSLYSFDCEFRRCRNSLLFNTSGIRAAAEKSSTYQNGHGCPWFYAAAMFLQRKNSRPEVYTDVHFWTGYFQKAFGKSFFKSVYSLWLHYCLCFKFFLCIFYTFFRKFTSSFTYTYMHYISINTPERLVSINLPHD